jgi:polyhydroxyalkanoate synthesis regulator phasin
MATVASTVKIIKASTQSVRFDDGMIVTAEDLTLGTGHPLALMQVLVRAYFGCGVVCGMALEATASAEDRDPCATSDLAYAVTVRPGVALDCAGFPLELCGPICLDLTPDPCVPPGPLIGDEQRLLHIAIRRAPEVRSASDTGRCGCGGGCACSGEGAGTAGTQCSRIRDAVEVAAFLDLPEGICLAEPEPERASDHACDCLKACPSCDRCGEWVYLGEASIDSSGIVENSVAIGRRAYVKPIACHCGSPDGGDSPSAGAGDQTTIEAKLKLYRDELVKQATETSDQVRAQDELLERMKSQVSNMAVETDGLSKKVEALAQSAPVASNQKLRGELDKLTARIAALEAGRNG